ncbi:DUF6355 family natural product biosynthesis protein [Streptomyces sp. NPDC001633]|uniref:DUF6355 family natural product biosynthesis protein n=1 Tax=Streptomyces sp. NPDC001633 TaxID=3364595 RepID=UPI00369E5A00
MFHAPLCRSHARCHRILRNGRRRTRSGQRPAKEPCGFHKTGSDAYYRHCASNGSNVVIKVEVAWAPDHERCVGSGRTWLGSASRIQGTHYVGRTC